MGRNMSESPRTSLVQDSPESGCLPDWASDLPAAASALRDLLCNVDGSPASLWMGPALRNAIFRYVHVFLPMQAAFLHVNGRNKLEGEHKGKVEALLRTAQDIFVGRSRASSMKTVSRIRRSLSGRQDDQLKSHITPNPTHLSEAHEHLLVPEAMSVLKSAPVPPLDVAFCWLLHRLSPTAYNADCIALFGQVLPAGNGSKAGPVALSHVWQGNVAASESAAANAQWSAFAGAVCSRESWRSVIGLSGVSTSRRTGHSSLTAFLPQYVCPHSAYKIGKHNLLSFAQTGRVSTKWVPPISFDLEAAAKRQMTFFFNIMTDYYEHEKSLSDAAVRYVRFLDLMREHPSTFLVPMYDIDLVWHAHLASTFIYRKDCMSYVGRFINHEEDDDRSASGKLNTSFANTELLWNRHFDEPYCTPETRYRGKPSSKANHVGYKGRAHTSLLAEKSRVNAQTP